MIVPVELIGYRSPATETLTAAQMKLFSVWVTSEGILAGASVGGSCCAWPNLLRVGSEVGQEPCQAALPPT